MRGDLTASDHADKVLEVGDLLIGELVQKAGDVRFQRAAVFQGLVAQDVEQLRIDHCRDKIEGSVCIGHYTEQGRFPVPNLFQLQVVSFHKLTDFPDVKGRHSCATGNQYAFRRFACNDLSTIS